MKTDQYSILFSSLTGNTKKLADAIHETLPEEGCEYFGAIKTPVPSSELLYIGFWTDKGNADNETLTLLSTLKNRRIFLFGTAGFGGSDAYFQKILGQVRQSIDPSNTIIGEYMCQGKMPQSVRERYMKMKENPEHPANLDALINILQAAFLKLSNVLAVTQCFFQSHGNCSSHNETYNCFDNTIYSDECKDKRKYLSHTKRFTHGGCK